MPDQNFDVLVDLSMDEEANRKVLTGASNIAKEYAKVEEQARKSTKAIRDGLKGVADAYAALNAKQDTTKSLRDLQSLERQYKDVDDVVKELTTDLTIQSNVLQKQSSIISNRVNQTRNQAAALQKVASELSNLSRLALVGGVGVVGGIFAEANRYAQQVKDTEKATAATREWVRQTERLAEARARIDNVLLQQALPLLEKAAEIGEKAANFLEANPELVTAALNVGLIGVGLGTIGSLVSKGIKLYADAQYLATVPLQQEAARLQLLASEKMLLAAELQAQTQGTDILTPDAPLAGGKGLAGFGSVVGKATVLLASFSAGLIVADKAFDALEGRDVQFKDYVTELKQILSLSAKGIGDIIGNLQIVRLGEKEQSAINPELGNDLFRRVRDALGLAGEEAEEASDSFEGLGQTLEESASFDKVLKAYEKYREEDLELVREHYAERSEITKSGLQQEMASNREYRASLAEIGRDTASSLQKLQDDYNTQYLKSEQQHMEARANILQDASDDVQRIQEDLRETLRKNFLEHKDREAGLIAARDALGLAKENRRFEDQQAEARRQSNLEIRRLRQELGKRLAELEAEYAAERALRYAEFVARATEIKQQAVERATELRIQHEEEIKRIREQTAAKIREADAQFTAERKRRYEYFVAQIRDLDAALLGERTQRNRYYVAMASDLEKFLIDYRAKLASLTTAAGRIPGKAEGDYTTGVVRTGEKGYEWIATHTSTVAAEKIIGQKITQDMFVRAMQALRAQNNATYIDQRKMSTPLSRDQKAAYKEAAIEALREVIGLT